MAATCALVRPDVFRSVALMSAPYGGPPALGAGGSAGSAPDGAAEGLSNADLTHALAALERPRKHYQWYYSTPQANDDMRHCPQGVHDFLRAYYHMKSADWVPNQPFPLASWTAGELAKLPAYYVMDLDKTMAETVAPDMPSAATIAACSWLPDEALKVYSAEYGRVGFQGGLQWYRCVTDGRFAAELKTFAGRTIDVPSCFVAGSSDWGIHQKPGEFEAMQNRACTDMRGCHLVDGAGHWVQQEQPEAVSHRLLEFVGEAVPAP